VISIRKRVLVNPRDIVLYRIIVLILIVLAFFGILVISVNYRNKNFSSAPINSSTPATTKADISAGTPVSESDLPILTFAVISDIHIRSSATALEHFVGALTDLTVNIQPKPDTIVLNGDLGDGTTDDYALLGSIIKKMRLNTEGNPLWFATIGNHEFYNAYYEPLNNSWSPGTFPNGDTDEKAIRRFVTFSQRERVYTDAYLKGYHFIFLGSEKSAMSDKNIGDSAYLSSTQLSWLEEKLKENYIPGKPIFVFLHQTLFNRTGEIGVYVIQAEQLNNILKKYPEIILFSGHLHLLLGSQATVIHNVFTIYNDSSTYCPISPDFKSFYGKSEGLYIEVFEDKIEVKGRDFINKTWIFENAIPVKLGEK